MQPGLSTDHITITEEELKALTDAIHQRHGIDFGCYEPKSLTRRVIRALHIFNMSSAHDLWVRILKDRAFIYPFMDEISVGLTSMFRDPVLWRKLRNMLSHEYKSKSSLSLWHAGCSTGEEVYTMGIVLKESN
jgi:chemotaxis protein methyltransferase CheR